MKQQTLLSCQYPSYSVEIPQGESITEYSEPLDLATMIERARLGIIDVSAYVNSAKSLQYESDNELEDDNVLPTFGMSREDAHAIYANAQDVAAREIERVIEKKTQGQPAAGAPDSKPSEE